MCLAALRGAGRAPGHTLTPVVLRSKQLLHLLPGDLDTGLSHHQACTRADGTVSPLIQKDLKYGSFYSKLSCEVCESYLSLPKSLCLVGFKFLQSQENV